MRIELTRVDGKPFLDDGIVVDSVNLLLDDVTLEAIYESEKVGALIEEENGCWTLYYSINESYYIEFVFTYDGNMTLEPWECSLCHTVIELPYEVFQFNCKILN